MPQGYASVTTELDPTVARLIEVAYSQGKGGTINIVMGKEPVKLSVNADGCARRLGTSRTSTRMSMRRCNESWGTETMRAILVLVVMTPAGCASIEWNPNALHDAY